MINTQGFCYTSATHTSTFFGLRVCSYPWTIPGDSATFVPSASEIQESIPPPAHPQVHLWGFVLTCFLHWWTEDSVPHQSIGWRCRHWGPSLIGLVVSRYSSDRPAGAPTHGLSPRISWNYYLIKTLYLLVNMCFQSRPWHCHVNDFVLSVS